MTLNLIPEADRVQAPQVGRKVGTISRQTAYIFPNQPGWSFGRAEQHLSCWVLGFETDRLP